MEIECLKDKLLRAVSKTVRLTSSKNPNLPILNYLLLESKENRLIIKATNLELGVVLEIPVKTKKEGIVAVPGDILNNLISNLPDSKSLKLESKDGELKIITEKNKTVIKTKDYNDFPSIPRSKSESFYIPNMDFVSGLKAVWHSCIVSSIKPELSSIFIYTEDKQIVFVATDSFRLAEKKIKIKQDKNFGQVLVPFKNAVEIARILEEENGELGISLDKSQVSLNCGSIYLTSRIIDSNFPDYKQIIPKESKTEVTVLKQDMFNALKVSNVLSDKFNQINFKIKPSEKVFEIKTKNQDVGESVTRVDAVFSGDDIEINFNLKYVNDCMPSIESDSLIFSFDDISRPMIIKGVSDKSFLYLVMPMNR